MPTRARVNPFMHRLTESLDAAVQPPQPMAGLASSTGFQPNEIFTRFAGALASLGDKLGIGPIQAALQKQGIRWKKSEDGMSIIMYVKNGETGTEQPIASIDYNSLTKPAEFQDQLSSIIDFAKGKAPGWFKQTQRAMQDQDRALRDAAKVAAAPQQPSAGPQAPQTVAPPAQPTQSY